MAKTKTQKRATQLKAARQRRIEQQNKEYILKSHLSLILTPKNIERIGEPDKIAFGEGQYKDQAFYLYKIERVFKIIKSENLPLRLKPDLWNMFFKRGHALIDVLCRCYQIDESANNTIVDAGITHESEFIRINVWYLWWCWGQTLEQAVERIQIGLNDTDLEIQKQAKKREAEILKEKAQIKLGKDFARIIPEAL